MRALRPLLAPSLTPLLTPLLMATLLLPLVSACGDKDDDTAASVPAGSPSLKVTSPQDGAWYDEGQEIVFSVEGRDASGAQVEATDVTWTTEGWSDVGAEVSTNALPPDAHDFTVEGTVDGEVLTETFEVTIWAASTNDTGTGSQP